MRRKLAPANEGTTWCLLTALHTARCRKRHRALELNQVCGNKHVPVAARKESGLQAEPGWRSCSLNLQRWEEDLDWGTKWVPVGHSSFMVADGLAGRYHNQWVGTMHLRQGSDILKLMTYDGKWTEGTGGRERQKAGTEKYNAHPRGIKGTDGRMVGGGRSEQPYGPDKKEMSRRQHLTIVTFIHNFWGRMMWGPTVMDLGREDDVSTNNE